jgi:hypothetical protein
VPPAPVGPVGVPSGGPLTADRLRRGDFAGCLFGATTPGNGDSAEALGAKLGRPLALDHNYFRLDQPVTSAEVRRDLAAGRTPFISVAARTATGPVPWADIAAGKQDDRLRALAREVKAMGQPVFLAFHHEPENDQANGTPADYKAAWQRFSRIMAEEGATNAVKVYVCMGWRPDLAEAYYPGDACDWVAGDPYNWAGTASKPGASWRSFAQAAGGFYAWARTKGKPIMIGETGTLEDPADPNRKARWIRAMGATLQQWPEVKALVYYNDNHDDGQGINAWSLSTPQAVAAMREVVDQPYFQPR